MGRLIESARERVTALRTYFSPVKVDPALVSRPSGNDQQSGEEPDFLTPVIIQQGASGLMSHLKIENDLLSRYVDYENMDEEPIVSSAYDIYADDATQTDRITERIIWPVATDENVKNEIFDLFDNRLNLQKNIWEITRSLCKYGNDYERMIVTTNGVVGLDFLPQAQIRRYEHNNKLAFLYNARGEFRLTDQDVIKMVEDGDFFGGPNILFDGWSVVHFRLRAKNRGSRYGFSVAEAARVPWKRLSMLEDSTIIQKVTRAPSRLVYYVNVGNKSPEEGYAFANKIRQMHKKKRVLNPITGQIELKPHIMSMNEDIYIPVREGKDPTRIESISGADYQSLELVNYFRNKLFAALKIPRAYLSYDENMPGRATLSAEDQKFARTELRVQGEVINGARRIVDVNFAAKGINPFTLEYGIRMKVPSAALELAQLEVEMTRTQLAQGYELHVSRLWILQNIYGFDEETALKIIEQKRNDMKADAQAQASGLSMDVNYDADKFIHEGNRAQEKRMTEQIQRVVEEMGEKIGKDIRNNVGIMSDVKTHLKLMEDTDKRRDAIIDKNFREIARTLDSINA